MKFRKGKSFFLLLFFALASVVVYHVEKSCPVIEKSPHPSITFREALANSTYASQSGFACSKCHDAVPALNNYGTLFKNCGYDKTKVNATETACLSGSVVKNTNDSGTDSLRNVVADAAGGSTITFDAALNGSTISLTSGHIEIDKDLTIAGPGVSSLKISGKNTDRIFQINGATGNGFGSGEGGAIR